jgi:sugar phosphate isomerase/epimerase
VTLAPDDLVMCAGTIADATLPAQIEAAAGAGCRGLSLWIDSYRKARAAGHSDADLRNMLADADVDIAELDPLTTWLPGADAFASPDAPNADFFTNTEDDFYRVAEAIGARSINAIMAADLGLERIEIIDRFAGLCERAAAHDLLVTFEFLPWTPVPSLESAMGIAEAADQPNGGVMLDSWHHLRSGASTLAIAKANGARILSVQLNDAPNEAEADVVEETLHRRRLPGDGDIDLGAWVAALRRSGSSAPLGIEIFSDDFAGLPAAKIARRCANALRRALS